ncbi:hypothetical protein OG453_26560 [Streptomyces sp. NBC_01381]|uniref:hypothetical protein n=1 Tax=Streptomyces sp. NBC_01381 TaxID=2903845 RepID=UPI00225AA9EB|nr:hypothetical protein [Streptomyces sp. NBC_01381]MCX4670214.1 hypothetical protein [Streptomyces sp. NBC_01381]
MSAAFIAGEAAGGSRGADGFTVAPLPWRAPATQARKPMTGTTQVGFTAGEAGRRVLPVATESRSADGFTVAPLPSRAPATQARTPMTCTTYIGFTAGEPARRTLPAAVAARGGARSMLPSRAWARLSQELGASSEIGGER